MSTNFGFSSPGKRDLGKAKFDFNGIKYNKGPNYGLSG
jgi:hypothetical protein